MNKTKFSARMEGDDSLKCEESLKGVGFDFSPMLGNGESKLLEDWQGDGKEASGMQDKC